METPKNGTPASPEETAKQEKSFYQNLTKRLIARIKKQGTVREFDHNEYTFNLYAILEEMGIDPKKAQNESEEEDLKAQRAIIWRREKPFYLRAIKKENDPTPNAQERKDEERYRKEFKEETAEEERWRDDAEANYHTHPVD